MSDNPLVHDLQHVQEGLAFLGEAFKNKANITALLTGYLTQIQLLEDAIWAVINAYILDNAVGVQLDDLGSLVTEPRLSRTDAAYRLAIRVQIRTLRSHGHDEDLLAIAALMGYTFTYLEQWPAGFEINQFGVLADFVVWAASKFKKAKAAGTGMAYVYSLQSQANSFIWSDSTGHASNGKGWGDSVSGAVGGKLAGVITA